MNADRCALPHPLILYVSLVGMLILFTELSKFHHGNPELLRHPIKAIVDSSATPDCRTKLTIEATGNVGVRSKHASELQNDKKIDLTDKEVFLL